MNAEVQVVKLGQPGEDIVVAGNRALEHTKNANLKYV